MKPISLCKGIRFCCSAQKKDVEKVKTISEEGTLNKSTLEKNTEITKDAAKTIQDEKNVQMEVPNAAIEKEVKEIIVDIEKEYNVSESMGNWFFHFVLRRVILIYWSYVNQSVISASDRMKDLDGFSFGIKAPEELQPKEFESILNPIKD